MRRAYQYVAGVVRVRSGIETSKYLPQPSETIRDGNSLRIGPRQRCQPVKAEAEQRYWPSTNSGSDACYL